ncbi:hypothetical protein GALMADRAFT_221689 [Galerina marginata CBS 339.88]|uniref:Uncharacterized protein n=1 Tax=Galerina marginata (strain CBS 339.88) TaxID=685588 RepID=A0A067TS74_GALM3|nr:hypothetical protein GALMADRAFT_221689 [Galerina marginata CBS 339.88]
MQLPTVEAALLQLSCDTNAVRRARFSHDDRSRTLGPILQLKYDTTLINKAHSLFYQSGTTTRLLSQSYIPLLYRVIGMSTDNTPLAIHCALSQKPEVMVDHGSDLINEGCRRISTRKPYIINFKEPLRISITLALTAIIASFLPTAFAQAPVNDLVSWPPGMLLLATILYATLGTSPDLLWDIEPVTGFFLFNGLPKISIPLMQQVNWVTKTCHFVPGIRSSTGVQNFWVRSNEISANARAEALENVLSQLGCVTYAPSQTPINEKTWSISPAGMMVYAKSAPPASPKSEIPCPPPIARDFLLFAAIDYHAFREWEVQILSQGKVVFSTKDMPPSSVIDVASEEDAIYLAAAHMVRRPHSQSIMRSMSEHIGNHEHGPYLLNLDTINRDAPICSIDFHSYAPGDHKVSATLSELGRAYYRVVKFLKGRAPKDIGSAHQIAQINVGRTIWVAILGGATLDTGRLTIQNLPGRWGTRDVSPDEAYLSRVDAVLQRLAPYGGTVNEFDDLLTSGGISRRTAIPFFIAGLAGQIIICYFLSVGTSAGIWTSVALANSLFAGRLIDWHSLYFGKSASLSNGEPGMKIYLPDSPGKEFMVIATFNRSSPKEGRFRPGFFMSTFGLLAAVLGAVYSQETRRALSFGPNVPTPTWIIYTSIVLSVATTILTLSILVFQQLNEKTWWDNSEMPTRWMVYATFPTSLAVCALAVVFKLNNMPHMWPILDAITWLSGIPFGMIENGRIISADENTLHLILLNRWMMGAVASALGSSTISKR